MAVHSLESFEFTVSHALYNDYNNVRIVAWAFEKKNNSPQNVGRSGKKGLRHFFTCFSKYRFHRHTRLAVISYVFGLDLSSRNMRRCWWTITTQSLYTSRKNRFFRTISWSLAIADTILTRPSLFWIKNTYEYKTGRNQHITSCTLYLNHKHKSFFDWNHLRIQK